MREGPDEKGQCWPQCIFFKCGNRSIKAQGNVIKCLWINDECIGSSCSYAICVRGKMLVGKQCGLTIRRLTTDITRNDDFTLDEKLKRRLDKRIKDVDDVL